MSDVDTSTLTTNNTTATAASTTTMTTAASPCPAFKPTSLIPHLATTTAKQVVFRDNVTNLAKFYEENEHYTVPKSDKRLFYFCKNMKAAIRARRERITAQRQLTDQQYIILKDIKFVGHTAFLEKSQKQNPVTKAYRTLISNNIESFEEQNGHTDILCPDAKFIKKISCSDGAFEERNIIQTIQDAVRTLKNSKVGKERKMRLKSKGIDLDADMIGSVPREDSEVTTGGWNEDSLVDVEARVIEDGIESVEEEVEVMTSDEGNDDDEDEAIDFYDVTQESNTAVGRNTLEDNTNEEKEKEVKENEDGKDNLTTEKVDGHYSEEEVNDDETVENIKTTKKKVDTENERAARKKSNMSKQRTASKKSNKPTVLYSDFSQRNQKRCDPLSQMNGQKNGQVNDSRLRRSRRRRN